MCTHNRRMKASNALRASVRVQLGALVGTQGIFHYIAFKLRERWGLLNTQVTLTLVSPVRWCCSDVRCTLCSSGYWRKVWTGHGLTAGAFDLQDGIGTANTALTFHSKQLLALVENDLPYVVRVL